MNHDNTMMIGFVGDEMTLTFFLLLCNPIVTINTLVSCIITPEKRFRPSITSIALVSFSPPTPSYVVILILCRMKHVDAFESRNAWVCVIMDLPPLIMMGNKKRCWF
jgi:hypothetical protein